MTITAKFSGKCRKCGGAIKAGETVDWVHLGVYHPNGNCPAVVEGKQEWVPLGTPTVAKGTYTAVFGRESDYETIRITQPGQQSRFFGKTIFKMKQGCSFEGVGFVDGDAIRLWKRVTPSLAERALRAFEVVKSDPAVAGHAYALAANRCYRCDRQLTVPVSIHRGLGPECAKVMAVAA